MRGPRWRKLLALGGLFCTPWWVSSAHAEAPSELEVVGKLSVAVNLSAESDEGRRLTGTLSDETGRPQSGTVALFDGSGRPLLVESCADLSAPPPELRSIDVPADGQLCARIIGAVDRLKLRASSSHFEDTIVEVRAEDPRDLPTPHFAQTPEMIDLDLRQPTLVEVVLDGSPSSLPLDTTVLLSLRCDASIERLEEVPTGGSSLARFEIVLPESARPGACELIAQVKAAQHPPKTTTRAVLVRASVDLSLKDMSEEADRVLATFSVTSAGHALSEGVVEVRENGAFLASSPVKFGVALIEVPSSRTEREVSARFLPASPAHIAEDPIVFTLPSTETSFRWLGIHTAAFVGFGLWLIYAWLRPRRTDDVSESAPPPREAVVVGTGQTRGPVSGHVLDAHTGARLGGIVVTLSAPAALTNQVLESVTTDEDGRFRFQTRLDDHPRVRLSAAGEQYMTLLSNVASSQVTVHLTERRRALIQNLASWAERLGPPWKSRRASTPGQIARVAQARGDVSRETWAERVASAAYSGADLSEEKVLSLKDPEKEPS